MNIELIIQHDRTVYTLAPEDSITWTTERKGVPGSLKFKVFQDDKLAITEGDAVRLKVDDKPIFYGFVFSLKRDKDKRIDVTAYDQLRYLKNKDTYVFNNKKASEIVRMIADDFRMQTGYIEDTEYRIASRVEENTSLFDMIQNSLDITLQNTKYMYVLYDDFGKLTLKGLDNMRLDVLIDEETGQNYDYKSSIDSNTYNRIKLTYDNDKTKTREVYIAQDSENMNKWGVLQYFEKIQKGENGQSKADALLSLYNKKTRNLSIKENFGDTRVRAGSMVVVNMNLGDIKLKNLMLVEKCKHEFKDSQHTMDLTLRGGEFIA